MYEYLAEYIRMTGDEDPDTNRHFKAASDEAAQLKLKEFSRKGEYWVLYRKVKPIKT